jgi:hypothetical protein
MYSGNFARNNEILEEESNLETMSSDERDSIEVSVFFKLIHHLLLSQTMGTSFKVGYPFRISNLTPHIGVNGFTPNTRKDPSPLRIFR